MKPCGVSYPHPKHDGCDGSACRPWPFPIQQPKCGKCYDTGWLHGAQDWTPRRLKRGTPYKSVRCECRKRNRPSTTARTR